MKKKKILFFSGGFGYGGSERSLISVVNHLDRSKFEIGLCVIGTSAQFLNGQYVYEALPKDVAVFKVGLRKRFLFCFFEVIGGVYQIAKNYDLLIGNRSMEPFGIAFIISWLTRKRFIPIIRHTLSYHQKFLNLKFKDRSLKDVVLMKMENYLLRRCFRVVAVSSGIKDDLVNEFKVKRERIVMIYDPIEVSHFLAAERETVEDIFLKGTKYIVSAARLTYEKNHALLLKAFAILRREMPAKLLLLGNGELENTLKELAGQLGLAEDVIFLGFHKNPYKFIARSDLLVLTSIEEGFGMVLVEAMACGVPVISSNCPSGPREIIQNGINGILISCSNGEKLAQEMITILKQHERRKKLIEQGLRRANDFKAEKIVKQYEQLFLIS